MNAAAALAMIKALAREGAFSCQGDPIFALAARAMDEEELNSALTDASRCEEGVGAWVVHTLDIWHREMQVALRLDPPTIVSIGPSC